MSDIGKAQPKGTRIEDVGNNAFKFYDGSSNYYFGVGENNLFYAGTSEDVANLGQQQAHNPIDEALRKKIIGQQLCLLVNMQALSDNPDYGQVISSFLSPIFGNAKTLIYHY